MIALNIKNQPQIPELFVFWNETRQSRFEVLQQRNSGIGRLLTMLILPTNNENAKRSYFDIEEKTR